MYFEKKYTKVYYSLNSLILSDNVCILLDKEFTSSEERRTTFSSSVAMAEVSSVEEALSVAR